MKCPKCGHKSALVDVKILATMRFEDEEQEPEFVFSMGFEDFGPGNKTSCEECGHIGIYGEFTS